MKRCFLSSVLMSTSTAFLCASSYAQTAGEEIYTEIYTNAIRQAQLQTELDQSSVNVSGFIQTGWEYSSGGGLSPENGFFIERARLNISGELLNEAVSYLISGEWDQDAGNFDLLDAYIDFRVFDLGSFETGASVRLGQFVPRFYSGFVDDPTTLTTYNYSVSALTFGQGRGQGIEVRRNFGSDLSASVFYNNGFNNYSGPGNNNYAIGCSFVYSLASVTGLDLNLNGGYAYNDVSSQGTNSYTLGGNWTNGPLSLDLDWIQNDATGSWDNWSLVSTLGYNITDELQAFTQWEYGEYAGDLNLLTVGANYDFNSHITWTNTLGFSLQDLGSNFVTDNTGWRAGAGDGQFVIRSVVTFNF